jgi:hypothetical protein
MSHTSLGLLACALVLAYPGGPAARHAHQLAWTSATGHAADCRRHHGARHGGCLSVADDLDEALPDAAVMDDLDSCSPFLAIDGDKELDFDTASGAVTETAGASEDLRGPASSPSIRLIGTFVASDQTGRVTMLIGGARREYTLVIPADGEQCILALGKANAVDLQQSWFGEISDDAEADAPDYQHAAAGPPQGGPAWRRGHHRLAPPSRPAGVPRFSPA